MKLDDSKNYNQTIQIQNVFIYLAHISQPPEWPDKLAHSLAQHWWYMTSISSLTRECSVAQPGSSSWQQLIATRLPLYKWPAVNRTVRQCMQSYLWRTCTSYYLLDSAHFIMCQILHCALWLRLTFTYTHQTKVSFRANRKGLCESKSIISLSLARPVRHAWWLRHDGYNYT